jgi:hypothetical protein
VRRFVPPAWVVSAAVVLVAVGGFGLADRELLHWYGPHAQATATPMPRPTAKAAPDVVVGTARLCDLVGRSGDPPSQITLTVFRRSGCGGVPESQKLNDRIEVTVRTGSGGSYVVTVAPDTAVNVGDVWRK